MKKITSLLLAGLLCANLTVPALAAENTAAPAETMVSFTDMPTNPEFVTAINWAVENNVTNGTSTTTFAPNADCTRAQIVTFLFGLYEK